MGRILTKKGLLFTGIILTALGFVPYLLLGAGSVITVHDQLDGEIFTYIYQAKYLFSGQNFIPEWLGGIEKTALFPPAPLAVLLYALLPPLAAFLCNEFAVAVTAFVGMYLLLDKLVGQKEISFAAALLFAYLPFYSVYGFSVAGIPLLAYAVLELTEGQNTWRNLLRIGCYGLLSSFVLIGYSIVGIVGLYCIYLLMKKKPKECGRVLVGTILLLFIYVIFNKDLILQIFGEGSMTVSHKEEYILHPQSFEQSFWDMFLHGSGHAPSYHLIILVTALMVLVTGSFLYKRMSADYKRHYRRLAALFLAAAGIAAFYAFFQWEPVCAVRQKLGGIFVYFQFDRIYWFYPVLWYVMLALSLKLIMEIGKTVNQKAGIIVCLMIAALSGFLVLWNSNFKRNVRQLAGAESSNAVTWEKYYGEEVFSKIKEVIGGKTEEYRVGSIGLNPAAAAYNGFYTIDGYSNNYDLAYKHKFREVIAGELEKDEALKQYFDDWGNRCYLFSAELGQNYYFEEADSAVIKQLDLNIEALKELRCDYIFSGAEIQNASQIGLEPKGKFRADKTDCRYMIYLYQVR